MATQLSTTNTLRNGYLTAISTAAIGGKRLAGVQSVSSQLGTGWKVSLRRDSVEVLRLVGSGALPVVGNTIVITQANIASTEYIANADIDTGAWEARIQNAAGTQYISGGVGRATTNFILSGDIVASEGVTLGTLTFTLPASLDQQPAGTPSPVGIGGTWNITFREEFDTATLNSAVWNDGIWYGDDGADGTVNYDVNNGGNSMLRIWPALNGAGQFFNRTIDTDGKYYQKFGFFEARMKTPKGKGVFPAFWLFDHPGSLRPEIDIAEWYGAGWPGGTDTGWSTAAFEPNNYGASVHHLGVLASQGPYKLSDVAARQRLDNSFHVYGCDWTLDYIDFYFDGLMIKRVSPYPIDLQMYIMLDLWYGSAAGTPNTTDTPLGSSNSFEIDYVRAWQRA